MILRNVLRRLRARLVSAPAPTPAVSVGPPPVTLDERAAFRTEVAQRILAGEGDEVVDLLRTGELTWGAVFGMGEFILMPAYVDGFDPDSAIQFRERQDLKGIEFFDQVLTRTRNGHVVLRHDDPGNRRIGFADLSARYIGFLSLPQAREVVPGHPGYEVYQKLSASTFAVRVARSQVGDGPRTAFVG